VELAVDHRWAENTRGFVPEGHLIGAVLEVPEEGQVGTWGGGSCAPEELDGKSGVERAQVAHYDAVVGAGEC